MTSAALGAGHDRGAPRRTASPDPGRGYAKGRAKREEILQAAVVLFGEVGFHAASQRELASRVGMSHPGLLHHFPTKVALLEAVLDYRDTVDVADLDEDLARGTDYFDALVRLVERNALRRHIVELFTALAAAPDGGDEESAGPGGTAPTEPAPPSSTDRPSGAVPGPTPSTGDQAEATLAPAS